MKELNVNKNNINFEKSVSNLAGLPDPLDYEIVLAGKSNVGKSSFINSLFNRKKLAKTSNSPGKTRLINYYNLDNKIYIVDLPGYGYSKMSKEEESNISNKINHYLLNRKQISLIILVLDIRHMPTEKDLHMYNYILNKNCPYIILLNKADKLKERQIKENVENIKKILGISFSPVIVYSSNAKGTEMESYRDIVFSEIQKVLLGKL